MLLSVERGERVAWQADWERSRLHSWSGISECSCPVGKRLMESGPGIRSDGALLVHDGDRVQSILAGDVRVRLG